MSAPSPLHQARRVFEIEIAALQAAAARLDERLGTCVARVKEAVDAGNKVIGIGLGKSGIICRKIIATMTSTGTPAVMLDGTDALHGDLGIVRDGDVILALSQSGETPELLELLPHLRRWAVTIIAITGKPKSSLASHADHVLDSQVEMEACPLTLAPTASTTVMLVLGDALAMALMEAHGFTRLDFAKMHPGGSLGKHLLLTARDIMRPLDRTVFAKVTDTIQSVVADLVAKRAGAAVVVDEAGALRGIFTHGDFARGFNLHGDATRTMQVVAMMSASPVFVFEDQLATEVAETVRLRRVDDVLVLRREDRAPLGIVDCQDLPRFKLV
jgi:arabinose-5-phosphate isomerase